MAMQALAQGGDGRGRRRHLARDPRPVLVERMAELGRLDPAGRAPQQLHAHRLFEELQPLADVRARGVQPARRGTQTAGIDDLDEQLERVQIHGQIAHS